MHRPVEPANFTDLGPAASLRGLSAVHAVRRVTRPLADYLVRIMSMKKIQCCVIRINDLVSGVDGEQDTRDLINKIPHLRPRGNFSRLGAQKIPGCAETDGGQFTHRKKKSKSGRRVRQPKNLPFSARAKDGCTFDLPWGHRNAIGQESRFTIFFMTVLGIDIGGTGIKGAPVNVETGELLAERFRIPTPHPALPNAVADVVDEIARHFNHSGPTGITFPAIVKKGVVYSASNVDESWIGTDAAGLFQSHLGGPVTVVNDADAAGIAEVHFGAGRGRDGVVILLTFGTGIGSAVFHDGRLLPNSEFGHLRIKGKDAEKRASEKVREDKGLS